MIDLTYAHKLNEFFASVSDLQLAYLFGSQVAGPTGSMSDYDFAVLVERDAAPLAWQARVAHQLAMLLDTDRIDLVLLNDAPVELAYAVIAQGVVVYQISLAIRVEYEAQVLARFGDYLPVLRAQRRAILQGGVRATRIQRYRAALGRTERTLSEIAATAKQTTRRF